MYKKIITIAITAVTIISTTSPLFARNNIRIVGSSTVYPFTKAVAERFARANPRLPAPIVESTGTGGGIKLFCAGVGANFPDIVNASRRMKSSEAKNCQANGVTAITEVQIGLDGLALATTKNSPLHAIAFTDVYKAIAKMPYGKPNTAKTWRDVNPKLPPIKITVYGPPTTSGTRSSLEDLFMEPACAANPAIAALKKTNEAKYNAICKGVREDGAYINAGENDNLIVQKLIANGGSVGLFGYSYLEANDNKLKGVAVNGVVPNYQNIASFKYPGGRAMFIYVKNAHATAIPGMRQFLATYANEGAWGPNGYLAKIGLIASPTAQRANATRVATTLTPLNLGVLK